MDADQNGRRKNGFEKPLNPMQISTWALLPTLLIQFALFAAPTLPLAAAIPCTGCVFGCGALTAYFTYRCCTIDPMDERLRCHLARQNGDSGESHCDASDDGEVKYCWMCKINVHETSMHCKFCNKCVGNFDHHCHWLNTCVGAANYKQFFLLLSSVLAMELIRGGTLAALVVTFFVQFAEEMKGSGSGGATLERSNSWFGADVGLVVAVVNTAFLAVDMACIVLLVQLFAFHIRLRRDGLTTYAYIVESQRKRNERDERRRVLSRRRLSAIKVAEQEGKLAKKWRLKAAGLPYVGESICRPCDPLPPEEQMRGVGQNSDQNSERRATIIQHYAANNSGVSSDGSARIDKENGRESSPIGEAEKMGWEVVARPHAADMDKESDTVSAPSAIKIIKNDDRSSQEIEVSPLHAAMERREVQQKLEEESREGRNSSHSNGEQEVRFLSTS